MNWRPNKACHFVPIDLETFALPPSEELIAAIRAEAEKEAREELVQEKAILARVDKAQAKFVEGGALDFERARVVSIAMVSDITGDTESFSSSEEADVARWFAERISIWQQEYNQPIRFVGFNITGFDLPMLHLMLCRHNQDVSIRVDKWGPVDLMSEPYGRFIGKRSLAHYLRMYGLPAKSAKGSEVNAMWLADLENKTKTVEAYNRQDVELEYQLFTLMRRFYEF